MSSQKWQVRFLGLKQTDEPLSDVRCCRLKTRFAHLSGLVIHPIPFSPKSQKSSTEPAEILAANLAKPWPNLPGPFV